MDTKCKYSFKNHMEIIDYELGIINKLLIEDIIRFPVILSSDKLKNLFYIFRNIVGSRVFGINNKNNENSTVVVPIADLFNYSYNHNTTWGYSDDNYFKVTATKPIRKGEQIFDTYGHLLSNNRLYLYYGFTFKNNFNGEIPIKINGDYWNIRKYEEGMKIYKLTNENIESLKNKLEELEEKNKIKYINYNINNIISSDIGIIKSILNAYETNKEFIL